MKLSHRMDRMLTQCERALDEEADSGVAWLLRQLRTQVNAVRERALVREHQLGLFGLAECEAERNEVLRQIISVLGKHPPANWRMTSRAAADAAAQAAPTQRLRVLYYLLVHPDTDDGIACTLKLPINSARPRRNELMEYGLIEDSGRTRDTRHEQPAVVWQVTNEVQRVLLDAANARLQGAFL